MKEGYTQEAYDYFMDLADMDIGIIWEDIQTTPADTPAELWEKKLKKIAQDYSFSSRFALMRLLSCRGNNISVTDASRASDFEYTCNSHTFRFADISLAHAECMTEEESQEYITCLMDLADMQADCDPDFNATIIRKAWDRTTLLTRSEALCLGHILDLTLPEMQWFLLRTQDVEDGFHMNRSEDIIEVYGFLTGASWQHVQYLKDKYVDTCGEIIKNIPQEHGHNWTQNISDSLPAKVESWKIQRETMDEEFLKWIHQQAPDLDCPSQTALRIYRNLASFTYNLIIEKEPVPDEDAYMDCMQDIYENSMETESTGLLFFESGKPAPAKCKVVADVLLLENRIQSASRQKDNTKAWHVLSTLANGTITSAGGVVNQGRTRVAELLSGKLQVEKSDLLYLLWFTSNLIWRNSDEPDSQMISCRVMDFMDASRYFLEAALLPDFYPPHPIEQSMLLAIVCGKNNDDPSVIYEYMLHSLVRKRKRNEGSRRHSTAEKIKIVSEYRNDHSKTLEAFAHEYGISPKTLSAWQKQLLGEGKIT